MFKSDSYIDKCCGSGCTYEYLSTKEKPCWGEVEVVGEDCAEGYSDCWWIHSCEGHTNYYDGDGMYVYENNPNAIITESD